MIKDRLAEAVYLLSDRRPWRLGYGAFRRRVLRQILNDNSLLEIFYKRLPLPPNFGCRLDARVVEIPWVLSHISEQKGCFLDAGSALNYEIVLSSPQLKNKDLSIVTLAPEPSCFYNLGVSYIYGDLRNLYFKDESFDTVICISTIEHIGMDNSRYADGDIGASGDRNDFINVVGEFKRILKKGGILYITFPYGRYEDHGWFQQFDQKMVDKLIDVFGPFRYDETIYKYDADGWKLSDRESCKECEFFDVHESKFFNKNSDIEYPPDCPAGERSVACLRLVK